MISLSWASMSPRTRSMCAFDRGRCGATFAKHAPRAVASWLAWLREHKVGKAVMEASGGYERDWAKALRERRHRGPDCRSQAGAQLRPVGRTAGQERSDRCAHDRLVRRDVRRGIRPGPRRGARGTRSDGERASWALLELQTKLQDRGEHPSAGSRAKGPRAALEDRSPLELAKLEAAIAAMIKADAAFCRTRRDHRERAGPWPGSPPPASSRSCPNWARSIDKVAAALLGVAPLR